MARRLGGLIEIIIDGTKFRAKGSFTYNLGHNKKEAIVGSDSVHGYKEMPQAPMIEGAFTDDIDLDVLNALLKISDATVVLSLANGKAVVLRNAWYAGDGNITTEEGEIEVKFEGLAAEEIVA